MKYKHLKQLLKAEADSAKKKFKTDKQAIRMIINVLQIAEGGELEV